MVARPMISALRSVKPRDLCVQTSKSKFGKRSSNKRCGVRMHQKNNHSIYDMSFRDLGIILKTLRVHQIYGEEDSSMYDPAIDLVRLRMHELKMQTLNDRMNVFRANFQVGDLQLDTRNLLTTINSWKPR